MTKCSICYNRSNYNTECKHTFCISCLQQWNKTSCPICRQEITIPERPHTRSCDMEEKTLLGIRDLFKTQDDFVKCGSTENALKYAEDIFIYIWKHRNIFRKFPIFKDILNQKLCDFNIMYKKNGYPIPKIFNTLKKY